MPGFPFYGLTAPINSYFSFPSPVSPAAFRRGDRLFLRSASEMIHWSWPLTERNSSAAHFSSASIVAPSTRSTKLLFLFFSSAIAFLYRSIRFFSQATYRYLFLNIDKTASRIATGTSHFSNVPPGNASCLKQCMIPTIDSPASTTYKT